MRTTASILCVTGLLAGLVACTQGPTFKGINTVKVRHIGQLGLTETEMTPLQEKELVKCLYKTEEINESQAQRELLQTTYLLEVRDGAGDRSFEMYTAENLKGNKGKYYVNRCVYQLIRDLQ